VSSDPRPFASTQGLFAWDGDFYRGLAQHGYGHEEQEALRFFPLYPLLARGVHAVAGLRVDIALLVLSSGFALVA